MPVSPWETIARTASAVLMQHMADKDELGDYVTVGYKSPEFDDDAEPYEWPAITSQDDEFGPVFDPVTDEESIKIVRTVEVLTENVTASGITSFQPHAWIVIDDVRWAINEPACKWDAVWVTFGVYREPLGRMNELRRAPV